MNNTMQFTPAVRRRVKRIRGVRSCLMCDRKFKSDGPHNRRCSRCNYLLEHAREGTYYETKVYSPASARMVDTLDLD